MSADPIANDTKAEKELPNWATLFAENLKVMESFVLHYHIEPSKVTT